MIQDAIERYDVKQDARFTATNARLDRNVHEVRNLRQTVTDSIWQLKDEMGKQITAGHAALGVQLESIRISIGASSGVNKYKEYLWPTLFAGVLAILAVLEALHIGGK